MAGLPFPRHSRRLPSPTRDPSGPPKVGSCGFCGRCQLPLMTEVPARLTSAPGYAAQRFGFRFFSTRKGTGSTVSPRKDGRGERRPARRGRNPGAETPGPRRAVGSPRPASAHARPCRLRIGKMAASALGWALRAARQVSPAGRPGSLPPLFPFGAVSRPARRGAVGRARRRAAGLVRPLGRGAAGCAPPQPKPGLGPGLRRRREQRGRRKGGVQLRGCSRLRY